MERFTKEELEKWWHAQCPKCGWDGLSRDCEGGEPIADTGDFNDPICPMCAQTGRCVVVDDYVEPDAQATIAALQARVNGLEKDSELLRQSRDDFRVKYESVKNDAITLQSQLTQRTVELHETQNHLADADNEVEQLRKQLSERTAGLEAASKAIAEWRKEIDSVLDKLDGREGDVVALQAELERVRALIKALPKVEGEITVKQRGDEFVVMVGTLIWLKCYKTDEILINAIVALWQHRQGMEG